MRRSPHGRLESGEAFEAAVCPMVYGTEDRIYPDPAAVRAAFA